MRISLIIPAYNEEKYIRQCLESVVKNGIGLYEVIVVDNASTDNTADIAKSFPNVRVVSEPKNGLIMARQRGFVEAQGDILAYIDADTRMPPRWSEKIQQEFSKSKDLACLSGPYIYYDVPRYQHIVVSLYWNLFGRLMYSIVDYMAVGGNFAIRKDVLKSMGGFDTSIEFYGEDTNIARRAHAFGRVKFDFSFVMHTSGRRFAGQGLIKTAALYMLNFLSETILHRPVTKKYKNIR